MEDGCLAASEGGVSVKTTTFSLTYAKTDAVYVRVVVIAKAKVMTM